MSREEFLGIGLPGQCLVPARATPYLGFVPFTFSCLTRGCTSGRRTQTPRTTTRATACSARRSSRQA